MIGTEPGDVGRPMWAFIRNQIVQYKLEKVPNYRGKWLASEKNRNPQSEILEASLQEPFRIQQLKQELLHMKQRNVSMLWVLLKS